MTRSSQYYVEERYRVADYEEQNIKPSLRPSIFSWRGWKSSVFYYTWRQAVGFICCYYAIQILYRHEISLSKVSEEKFQFLVENWNGEVKIAAKDLIFLLGFYVSMVARRWWDQVSAIPEIDQMAVLLGGLVLTNKTTREQGNTFKLTLIRHLLLAYALLMRKISKGMKKEFWSLETLIEKKLLSKSEAELFDTEDMEAASFKWNIPLVWANESIKQSKFGDTVLVPVEHKQLLNAVRAFQEKLQRVNRYVEYPIPTVYKQVVMFAVCSFFSLAVVAEQELIYDQGEEKETFNVGFPIFLLLKFVFIAGWLSVAETIRNPFGEDEEDVNVVRCLDYNIWIASVVVQQQDRITLPCLN